MKKMMVTLAEYRATNRHIAIAALFIAPTVNASTDPHQRTDTVYDSRAVVIEQPAPESPRRARRMQEAWVQMSYVVTSEGRAIDPIITDSSGGIGFEDEVRKVTEQWRFEPTSNSRELPYNILNASPLSANARVRPRNSPDMPNTY
jgi:hypothetical protein